MASPFLWGDSLSLRETISYFTIQSSGFLNLYFRLMYICMIIINYSCFQSKSPLR